MHVRCRAQCCWQLRYAAGGTLRVNTVDTVLCYAADRIARRWREAVAAPTNKQAKLKELEKVDQTATGAPTVGPTSSSRHSESNTAKSSPVLPYITF